MRRHILALKQRYIILDTREEWWEALARFALIFVSLIAGLFWAFGSARWHSAPAYSYIDELRVPWRVWGAIFLAQSFFLAMPLKVRLIGYLSGFVSMGYFGVMLLAAACTGRASGPLGFASLIGYAAIHLAGTRNYIFSRAEAKIRHELGA